MMKGGHGPTKELQDLDWCAFDHATHASQLRSCNYCLLSFPYGKLDMNSAAEVLVFHLCEVYIMLVSVCIHEVPCIFSV